jgi:hypothetical protein
MKLLKTLFLASSLLSASSEATPKKCPLPTVVSIGGVWVAADDSFDYRLVIQPDGRGGFGIRDHAGGVYVFSFDSIAFDGVRFAIHLESMKSNAGPISVTGQAPCSRPDFRFEFAGKRLRVAFFRDDDWRQAQTELGRAMVGLTF